MKKYIFSIMTMLFIANCANLDFVYKSNKGIDELINNTNLIVVGDEASEIYIYIKDILGSTNDNNSNYQLSITSARTQLAQIIEKDATASKFSIEYDIFYNLYNSHKNCKVIEVKNLTKSSYDSKSAGYSFGTDLSKKETEIKIISKNIDQFISSVNKYGDLNNCNSEN